MPPGHVEPTRPVDAERPRTFTARGDAIVMDADRERQLADAIAGWRAFDAEHGAFADAFREDDDEVAPSCHDFATAFRDEP